MARLGYRLGPARAVFRRLLEFDTHGSHTEAAGQTAFLEWQPFLREVHVIFGIAIA